jgi:NAD(P)-dependent dehydrogenase (short-subunit alcohol dehydrogenase family)
MATSTKPMSNKACLITGANSGMGKETALGLAKLGATVIMVCRDQSRGEAAQTEIKAHSGNTSVELLLADLSSQQSVRALAQEFLAHHTQLHVLVNNAGVYTPKRSVTVDGLETTFATNHLGPFLLTNLLLPLMKASGPARVITVTSAFHTSGKLAFDDLQGEHRYNGTRAYNQSKLANVLFTYELARRLAGTGVTATVLEPGFVKTNLGAPFFAKLFSAMQVSPEQGAQTAIYLASSAEVEGVSGQYFSHKGKATQSSKASYDERAAGRLWQISEEMNNLVQVT